VTLPSSLCLFVRSYAVCDLCVVRRHVSFRSQWRGVGLCWTVPASAPRCSTVVARGNTEVAKEMQHQTTRVARSRQVRISASSSIMAARASCCACTHVPGALTRCALGLSRYLSSSIKLVLVHSSHLLELGSQLTRLLTCYESRLKKNCRIIYGCRHSHFTFSGVLAPIDYDHTPNPSLLNLYTLRPADFLKTKLDEEKAAMPFTEMPPHFQEISALLFEWYVASLSTHTRLSPCIVEWRGSGVPLFSR
jgi:hypothetical protein